MKINLNKVAAILAVIIGGMSVFAGGLVLLGTDPGYNVINWLALYNYTVGILTVIITAVLIYTNHRLALPAAIGTLVLNALVLLILQTAFREIVAPDSIRAMIFRLVVWGIILGLLLFQVRKSAALRETHDATLASKP